MEAVTIWLTISGASAGACKLLDMVTKSRAKKESLGWLLHRDQVFNNWAKRFSTAFDSVFGERHFTWHCFLRSSVASVAAVLILAIVWGIRNPERLEVLPVFLVAPAMVNLIPDYLSLLESRYVIKKLQKAGPIQRPLLLALDLIATYIIFAAAWTAFITFASFLDPTSASPWDPTSLLSRLWANIQHLPGVLIAIWTDNELAWVWFYSTYLTSFWVWLYIIAGLIARAGQRIPALVALQKKYIKQEHLYLSMGMLCWLVLSPLYWLYVWFFWK